MKLERSILITGKIHCVSGLCIGGSSNTLEIGGVSQEVVKNPITKEPYIPGSSLKGKMRSELEKRYWHRKWESLADLKKHEQWEKIHIHDKKKEEGKGKERGKFRESVLIDAGQEPCGCGKKDCLVCVTFGAYKNPGGESAPTRIIVRDAMLSEESRAMVRDLPLENRSYFERKVENIVKRDSGTADSPRTIERVLAGMSFDFEIILRIFEGDEEKKLIAFVKEGLEAVQSSYLGGSGSRGSGQVRIDYHIEGYEDAENVQPISQEA